MLAAHQREWLGVLAPHLLDAKPHPYTSELVSWSWRRGHFASLKVPRLTMRLAHAIADAPQALFLRELHIVSTAYHSVAAESDAPPRVVRPEGVRGHDELFELFGSPCLRNLRRFRVGDEPPAEGWTDCHVYVDGLDHLVAQMPRIEELHLFCTGYNPESLFSLDNLGALRVLRVPHLGAHYSTLDESRGYEHPLDLLAANPALVNLRELEFHPHYAEKEDEDYPDVLPPDADFMPRSFLPLSQVRHLFASPHLKSLRRLQLRLSTMGDDGVREMIDSGFLARLKHLDIRHGCVTDVGAAMFAACPEARRLKVLDLSRNGVTDTGLRALREAGVNARADNPLTPDELARREYLYEGDFE